METYTPQGTISGCSTLPTRKIVFHAREKPLATLGTRERLACGKDWLMVSGEDGTALGYNAHGGQGCISVTANLAP